MNTTKELENRLIANIRQNMADMKDYTIKLQTFAAALKNFAEKMHVFQIKTNQDEV